MLGREPQPGSYPDERPPLSFEGQPTIHDILSLYDGLKTQVTEDIIRKLNEQLAEDEIVDQSLILHGRNISLHYEYDGMDHNRTIKEFIEEFDKTSLIDAVFNSPRISGDLVGLVPAYDDKRKMIASVILKINILSDTEKFGKVYAIAPLDGVTITDPSFDTACMLREWNAQIIKSLEGQELAGIINAFTEFLLINDFGSDSMTDVEQKFQEMIGFRWKFLSQNQLVGLEQFIRTALFGTRVYAECHAQSYVSIGPRSGIPRVHSLAEVRPYAGHIAGVRMLPSIDDIESCRSDIPVKALYIGVLPDDSPEDIEALASGESESREGARWFQFSLSNIMW